MYCIRNGIFVKLSTMNGKTLLKSKMALLNGRDYLAANIENYGQSFWKLVFFPRKLNKLLWNFCFWIFQRSKLKRISEETRIYIGFEQAGKVERIQERNDTQLVEKLISKVI